VESVESGTDPDVVVAAESWRRYRLRNDSVITDVFTGQFKSHLTCPNKSCQGLSWRKFDPFVAVPCPVSGRRRRSGLFFFSFALRALLRLLASLPACVPACLPACVCVCARVCFVLGVWCHGER
jgi:hypothetical protein